MNGYESRLKGFITSIEESNQNFTWNWDEQSLKGCYFGGIFREEEFETNGEIKTSVKLWQVRSVKNIQEGNFEIPAKKELPDDVKEKIEESKNEPFDDDFLQPVTDDDLPF